MKFSPQLNKKISILALGFILAFVSLSPTANAADNIPSKNAPAVVERIFSGVFGKKITPTESEYWKNRARSDKTTESALKGAMYFQKAKGLTMPKSATVTKPTVKQSTVSSPSASVPTNPVSLLDGTAILIANDGTYLGLISSNEFASESIINPYGSYGSKYASKSIFNEYGRYGGAYSSQSPFNKYTSTPPRIFLGNDFVGYLTINSFKASGINTYSLIGYLQSH